MLNFGMFSSVGGLGSTSDVHIRKAMAEADRAIEMAHAAERHAADGEMKIAMDEYEIANRTYGRVLAHLESRDATHELAHDQQVAFRSATIALLAARRAIASRLTRGRG